MLIFYARVRRTTPPQFVAFLNLTLNGWLAESRLLDEVIDWLSSNGTRINLQGFRRLHDEWPVAQMRVLATISGGLATQSIVRKWITLSDALPVFHKPDPDLLRHGPLRDPLERRLMSQSPNPSRAASLLCGLRALLGVNARAEIIACLLNHGSGRLSCMP